VETNINALAEISHMIFTLRNCNFLLCIKEAILLGMNNRLLRMLLKTQAWVNKTNIVLVVRLIELTVYLLLEAKYITVCLYHLTWHLFQLR